MEANRYYDLSISLAPDQQEAHRSKADNYISWLGDTKRAGGVLEKMPGKRRALSIPPDFSVLCSDKCFNNIRSRLVLLEKL